MFYLKYRPKKFAELFGLEDISQSLQKALQKGQVAHAYVFSGPKGSGKTTTARILAKAINCERLGYGASNVLRSTFNEFEPCNECSACLGVNEGRFLDLIEIDAASNRGIDDIRQLRERIKLAPSQGRFKVYIIDEAHMLTHEAFNALLKTLEEPPAHAIFILATTEYHKLPETIRSRCLTLKFRRAIRADIIKKLSYISEQEKAPVEKDKLSKIAVLAEGGYRNAETLLEQFLVGELNLDGSNLTPSQFLALILKNEKAEALQKVEQAVQKGENMGDFLSRLVVFVRHLLLLKGGVPGESLDLIQEELTAMDQISKQLTSADVVFLLGKFLTLSEQEKYSPLPQLPLEIAIIDLAEYFQRKTDKATHVSASERPDNEVVNLKEKSRVDVIEEDVPAEVEVSVSGPLFAGTLAQVLAGWDDFLKAVKPLNHSLEALLRSARPKEVGKGGLLIIEVFYKFHKEKLSQPQNVVLVQRALAEILKAPALVSFVLGQKKDPAVSDSTPVSVETSAGDNLVETALEAFGT